MRFHLDIFRQQGLTPEDRLLHLDKHLRRNVLFEHVARETYFSAWRSLHPYHWVLKARRRERFCRIDYAAPGFFVPEHVRAETQQQTYVEFLRLQSEWANHLHNNYYSDMTPEARRSVVPKINPLELIQNFGVLRNEAWNRYCMTESGSFWTRTTASGSTRTSAEWFATRRPSPSTSPPTRESVILKNTSMTSTKKCQVPSRHQDRSLTSRHTTQKSESDCIPISPHSSAALEMTPGRKLRGSFVGSYVVGFTEGYGFQYILYNFGYEE